MKVQYLILVFLFFSVFSVHAAKKTDAKSVKNEFLFPANVAELSTDFFSIEKGKALVQMFHNDENVKVQIVVPEQSIQIKFLMQGLNVFIDISGKKSKKYCVQFPKPERRQIQRTVQQPREEGQQNIYRQSQVPGQGPVRMPMMDVKQMAAMANESNAVLVNGKNKTELDKEIAFIQAFEDDKLLFTINLPLSLLGDKIGKDKIISIGLLSEMEAPSGMGSGGGMGGPGGGGMRQGGGGMRSEDGGGMGAGGGGMRSADGGGGRPMGGGGSVFAEMNAPFNHWVTFGID